MTQITINVAEEFTRYPAGRYVADGPFSGEKFRTEFLLPIINSGNKATLNLDGTRGYGSSFLEEAFGGLVRLGHTSADVLNTFDLASSDNSLIMEIKEYIQHGGMPGD